MPRLVFKRSLIFLLAVRRDVRELDQISTRDARSWRLSQAEPRVTRSGTLAGRVALVTGAAQDRGIGRGIALVLAERGADVAINDVAFEQEAARRRGRREAGPARHLRRKRRRCSLGAPRRCQA